MKKEISIALLLSLLFFSINLVLAVDLSPGGQTDVRVTVSDGTAEPGETVGSGDSGNGDSQNNVNNEGVTCKASWECGEWEECLDFFKERICIDTLSCISPPEKIDKSICIPEKEELKEFLNKKGPLNLPNYVFVLILLIILITIIVWIFLIIRKSSKKKRKKKSKKRKK